MNPLYLSKLYNKLQVFIHYLPKHQQVKIASWGRSYFMQEFVQKRGFPSYIPPVKLATKMWGIDFRTPISNAAGMFKNGDGYDIVAKLGAGAYIGGTSTNNKRKGNNKNNIKLPFISLDKSRAAINWLGLPNLGDDILSNKLITKNKITGCPIGWSVMRSPDYNETDGMERLIKSLWLYHDNPQIDFIEINESCPNIQNSSVNIIARLEIISKEFLKKRNRHLPVVIKLSNDISYLSLDSLIPYLISLGYDGVNIGNTSTIYDNWVSKIDDSEQYMFNYFTKTYGGGVSGEVLRDNSLKLCTHAVEIIAKLKPTQEFHVIRTGGINSFSDLLLSQKSGISFNQWYTGFFDSYSKHGDRIYQEFFN
jgi:dihydroorotate dehydrogenase